MKTPREWVAEHEASNESEVIISLTARDNEHAAVIAALQRTIETLGADVLRLARELERAVEFLRRANVGTLLPRALRDNINDFIRDLAAPQPEPVKAHAYRQSLVAGKCACGNPDGPPWHAPSVPENAGATCAACKGFAGFDSHGNPTMLHKPENACGVCDGKGWTK